MGKPKKFDEISIMHVLAMTMIVAFHSMCFYNGRWTKVNAIDIPIWNKVSTFLDVIDLNMFVFISGYLYGYLYIYRNKYRHPSEVIRNKAVRLLIPYCFWGIIMVVSFPWNLNFAFNCNNYCNYYQCIDYQHLESISPFDRQFLRAFCRYICNNYDFEVFLLNSHAFKHL